MRIVLAVLLIGCGSGAHVFDASPDGSPICRPTDPTGAAIVRDCGDPPVAPGWSVSFDPTTGAATMSGTDYNAIKAYRTDVEAWSSCVIDYP